MTEKEFDRIAAFLKSRYGIDMSQKKEIVNGRLVNYVRSGGWKNYTDYMDAVEKDDSGHLEKELVNLLSTNHTYFMRETEHFDFLKKVVLPWLKQKEARKKDLSIWCGASSSGEEPYTLAMIMKDFFGMEHKQWDTKILATDISTDALRQAIKGVYAADELSDLPDSWKRRFFQPVAGGTKYEVKQELKNEVIFRKFNLMDPFPFRRKMQVIFLRNVMIYFDARTKAQLVRKLYDLLEPGGYLFIGQTETLDRKSAPFQMVRPSIFRK